ncbi:response regulator transcription factor [Enterococcus saccharolyticus]|uniref:response regulator transcription factor n=1 Tax=Enterococcus saccharolyticus TaxID=41997 RepID=UPI0039E0EA6B
MSEVKILIVEDDVEISQLLQVIVQKMALEAVPAYSGTEALFQLEKQLFDLVLLDLMLPGLSGEDVLTKIRQSTDIPVLILSARTEIEEKVTLLKMGADDYVTKPFNQEEVAARIDVQLRKKVGQKATQLMWKELVMDVNRLTVRVANQELSLTNSEFDILELLMRSPEQAFSKKKIYEAIWKGTYVGDDNTISVHISHLRKKIAVVSSEEYIKTIWGIGFMLI